MIDSKIMPRGPRITYPHAVFHVINRFVDRHPFFRSRRDYETFLEIYFDVAETFGLWTYAYDLMPNHFHFVLETPSGEISSFLQRFLTRAVHFLNARHGRIGHLLQGRTKTLLVEKDEYLTAVIGYALLNRVRAGLAQDVFSDPYNSVGETLTSGTSRLARGPLWGYLFGHEFDERKKKGEIALCRKWLATLDVKANEEIFRRGHRGSFLGSAEFRRKILSQMERRRMVVGRGIRRKTDRHQIAWSWEKMIAASETGVGSRGWRGLWRNRETAVKHVTWYMASVKAGWSHQKIRESMNMVGISHSRVTMAIGRIRSSPAKREFTEKAFREYQHYSQSVIYEKTCKGE